MHPRDLILELAREAGDDISDPDAVIEAFVSNHHPDDIEAAADGDVAAIYKLRVECGLVPIR